MNSKTLVDSFGFKAVTFEEFHRIVLAIALLGAWGTMIFYLLGFQETGPYVVAIYEMLMKDVSRFSMLMVVLLMGYTQATFVLENTSTSVPNPNKSLGAGMKFARLIRSAFQPIMQDFSVDSDEAEEGELIQRIISALNSTKQNPSTPIQNGSISELQTASLDV